MSNRKKQFDSTLFAIGVGALVTGATYAVYSYLRSRGQEEPYSRYPSGEAKKRKIEGEVCPICFEELGPNCCTFSCQHTFHKKCITQWKAISKTCPVCRTSL